MPSLTISVSPEAERITEALKSFPKKAQAAVRSALYDALKHGRTQEVRQLDEKLQVRRKKDIRSRISISAARAVRDEATGDITISYKALPLRAFEGMAASRATGVTGTTIVGSTAITLRHAFKARMPTGHAGFFSRSIDRPAAPPKQGRYAGKIASRGPNKGELIKRQFIREHYGPTVVGVAQQPDIEEPVVSATMEYFVKRLASKVDAILAGGTRIGRRRHTWR